MLSIVTVTAKRMSSPSKVALVTGSTSGIGLACVKRFAKRGINVIITGSRDKSAAASLLAEFQGSVDYCVCAKC